MHETNNIQFANAKQAKEVYCYKNIRTKPQKTNAAIWISVITVPGHLNGMENCRILAFILQNQAERPVWYGV
jgi:hypothetical protein